MDDVTERPTFNIFFHLSLTAASSLLFLNTDVSPITQLEKHVYTIPIFDIFQYSYVMKCLLRQDIKTLNANELSYHLLL